MADISKIQAPNDTTYNIKDLYRGCEYIRGTQTATTGAWTGVSADSELVDGKQILYFLPFAGSGNATLNLTLANGTTTGAKNVYFQSTTRMTTHYGQYSQFRMIYHKSHNINGTNYEGWWSEPGRDTTTTNATQIQLNSNALKAGSSALVAGNIIVAGSDGLYKHLKSGTAFDITWPIVYLAKAVNASATTNDVYSELNFTVTTTQSITLTAQKPVYIKGTFTPVSTTPLTQTVPSSADGYHYILLGYAYGTTTIRLFAAHPVYAYINGSFGLFSVNAGNASTVNGLTVEKAVPSNAVFTDTNTKVTSSANHYTPATASGQDKTASASGGTAAWSIDVVQGVTLNTDGKGHVTGLSVTSGKIPANPNTDTKVRQTLSTTNKNYPLLMSYAESSNTTANIDNVSYRANAIYANPSTGNLQVTKLNGVTVGSSPKFTDNDTHRVIKVNGTQLLGNNTTAVNFKNGTNVTLTGSGGDITINASGGDGGNIRYNQADDMIQILDSNGTWHDYAYGGLIYKYIYKDGNYYPEITGGWICSRTTSDCSINYAYNGTTMKMTTSNSDGCYWITQSAIACAGLTLFHAAYTFTSGGSYASTCRISILNGDTEVAYTTVGPVGGSGNPSTVTGECIITGIPNTLTACKIKVNLNYKSNIVFNDLYLYH